MEPMYAGSQTEVPTIQKHRIVFIDYSLYTNLKYVKTARCQITGAS